jgi:hypothetical protein
MERRPVGLYEMVDGYGWQKVRLHAHSGQQQAWESTARFVFVIAGHQSGKTSFGPHWLLREIRGENIGKGPGDYYAVTSTYDLFKVKMLPELLDLFEREGWRYHASDQVLVSSDGLYRVILRSATALGGLEAGTAKAAWVDECGQDAFPLEAWEAIQRRLAIHQGRVLGTTTPYNLGWLKTVVFDRWVGGDPDYEVIQFRSIDNPAYPRAEYERQRATLPRWKFEMFCNGNFSRPAGLVYGDYVDSYAPQSASGGFRCAQRSGAVDLTEWKEGVHGHLVRAFSIPPNWLRYVGVDPGGTEHTALVWLAEEPGTGRYYAYREAIGGGLTGAEHARAAREYGEPVKLWVGGAASEEEARLNWRRAGVPLIETQLADVDAGIDRVIGLLKTRRLFVMDTVTGLRSELGTYRRELDAAGEPLERIAEKERFHRLDALRYICSALPLEAPRPAPAPAEGPTRKPRELREVARRLR